MKQINNITHILLFAIVSLLISCENSGKDKYLDEYSTILYFLDNGVQNVDLYKTGQNTIYPVNITKAGSNSTAASEFEIIEVEIDVLEEFNLENNTSYTILPKEYYSLGEHSSIAISANETYVKHNLEFYTNEIEQLFNNSPNQEFVLALTLISNDSINANKNLLIINPQIKTPTIEFGEPENISTIIKPNQTEDVELEIPVQLGIDNKWEFTATVKVNNELIDEYNRANKTEYKELLPNQFKLHNEGELAFSAESNIQTVKLTVDVSKVNDGNFIIPLQLTDISNKDFAINTDKGTLYYIVEVQPVNIELTEDMLYSNAIEPSEGSLANLLDGDTSSYFHSAWSINIPEVHYLSVSLNKPIKKFAFDFIGRDSNGNGNPAQIIIEGSEDGDTYFLISNIENDKLPTGALAKYSSQVYDITRPVKHLKFTIPQNKTGGRFFVWSEFRLFEGVR